MVSLTIATTALNLNQEMTDFNYKKYSLENLENWMHDAMSAGEATPQEIYDTIRKVVEENYYIYKQKTSEAYELLALLNGNGKSLKHCFYEHYDGWDVGTKSSLTCDKDDPSPECKKSWNDFWEENYYPEKYKGSTVSSVQYTEEELNAMCDEATKNRIVKWQLPVQVDGLTGDCYINLPDDLLEAANLNEGDTVKWVDNKNGTYTMIKTTEPLGMDDC